MAFDDLTWRSADRADVTVDEALADLDLPDKDNPDAYLESEEVQRRFRLILECWRQARDREVDSRLEQIRDHDFYDGDQWSPEDKEELDNRGQVAMVFNQVKPALDWIIGTEKRTRVDYQILPRGGEDREGAEAKTGVMKYLDDVNSVGFVKSQAFGDAVKSGVGWVDTGIDDESGEEEIFIDYEDWRNVWYDPFSKKLDMSDARFLFRAKWLDLDMASALYPRQAQALRSEALSGNTLFEDESGLTKETGDPEETVEGGYDFDREYTNARPRVRMIECWYRQPERTTILRGDILGTYSGMPYDQDDPDQQYLVEEGHVEVVETIRRNMRRMIFCGGTVLEDGPSPYQHNRFPLVPIWTYRSKRKGWPYGVVRNLRDPQSDLNKRLSKALFILSTNKTIADEDAVKDWDEYAEEVSRPDAIIRKKKGAELELKTDNALAKEHVNLMSQDAEYIQRSSGVVDELMGRQTNAVSGTAIARRQNQGHVVTAEPFDNYRLAHKLIGQNVLSLVEQFYVVEKTIRILGEKNKVEFKTVNQQNPETGQVLNDITARQADYIVDESAWNATIRQSMFEALMDMTAKYPPEISIQLLDVVVELSDLPQKDELVRRIRQINGQQDPDQDEQDPQVLAERQAQIEAQQRQAQIEAESRALELEKIRAEIEKLMADSKARLAGIEFDAEKLKLERFDTIGRMVEGKEVDKKGSTKELTPTNRKKGTGPYREQGLQSNNEI